jgi:hypothetical protein
MRFSPKIGPLVLLPFFLLAPLADAQTIILQRSFITKYKDRATIDATFTVDHAHRRPNAPVNDGDLHAAGRSEQVGLPFVSEVMNAAEPTQTPVVTALQGNQGKDVAVPIAGAWRIWFEHPSQQPQVQFDPVPPAANTNPNHCFEIHPITAYAGTPVLQSLHEIPGFTPKDAATAFGRYEQLSATIDSDDQTVTITAKQVGFNYVKFNAQLAGTALPLDTDDSGKPDGKVILANILDDQADGVLVNNVRLIFIAGTPPADALASADSGATLQLLGIPRVNLNAIAAFVDAAGPGQTVRKLPYEMIVVAVSSTSGAPAPPLAAPARRRNQP